jgi:hypothetical protein
VRRSTCKLRRVGGARTDQPAAKRRVRKARPARRVRHQSEYGKPQGKRTEGAAIGLAPEREAERQVTNMSVAFLRSESGGQVKMTFTGNISSLGYLTAEEAKLNAIVRAKGGASLHSWSFGVSVKCADKDQPLTPLTHDVPNDLAQNIFTNVSTVGIGEPAEPNFPGMRVQRCN